jgi:DNA-binding NarL/FixJ family response regulator
MKILIADDHALFRDSLRSLLEARGLAVVGEARNGSEAVELARELQPEVLLMDLSMPRMDGLAATRLISAELPEIKVVVLTASDEDAMLFEAIKSGAQGFLSKNLESEEFFSLLDRVGRGEPALTPTLARKLLQEFARPSQAPPPAELSGSAGAAGLPGPPAPIAPAAPAAPADGPDALTEREREILELLVSGVTSNRKLARELELSENTIKFHIRNILDKLHLHNRAQAVSYAIRKRIVEPPGGEG